VTDKFLVDPHLGGIEQRARLVFKGIELKSTVVWFFGIRGKLYKTSQEGVSLLFPPLSLFQKEEETTRKLVALY